MRSYIQLIKDVRPDGNCGFRAIVGLMGFGEDGWRQVRRDMLDELLSHPKLYDGMYWEKVATPSFCIGLSILKIRLQELTSG